MRKALFLAVPFLLAPLGCGSSTPEPMPPPPPVASAPPPVVETPPPPHEPTAEEKQKAAAAKELAEDRAKMEEDTKAENARWSPELHKEAKDLAAKKYATAKAGITAAMKGHHRAPGHADRDKFRHPVETLEFFGMTPTMSVLEYGPGEGWFTELLAPTLAAKGKLTVTASDPNGPADQRSTYYGERLKRFLDRAPEVYGGVDRIVYDARKPSLGVENKFDLIVVARAMHGMAREKILAPVLADFFKALKPGGVLGVEQHRAKEGANMEESAKMGYLPEAWLIKEIEAAGFKLEKKSEINANPKDTKDYAEGVWTLPPSLALKDKDRQRYVDIGESDRMTLKFVKPKTKK